MKRAAAEDRIADVLTGFAARALDRAPALMQRFATLSPGPSTEPGPEASAAVARLVVKDMKARQEDVDEVVAAVEEVLTGRGATEQDAFDEAFAMTRQLETLGRAGLPVEDLARAARVLAALATGGTTRRPDDARAAQDAWRRLHAAQLATLPGTQQGMLELMAAGPEAFEEHRTTRSHELGVDALRTEFVAAWEHCLRG